MPTFAAIPLRTSSAGGSLNSSSDLPPATSGGEVKPQTARQTSATAAPRGRRNPHHLTGLGVNASWEQPEPTTARNANRAGISSTSSTILGYRQQATSRSRTLSSGGTSGGGGANPVVLTGGGIRRQHPQGQPTIQPLVPLRSTVPAAENYSASLAPKPPRRGPITVEELLAEQKREQLRELEQRQQQQQQQQQGHRAANNSSNGGSTSSSGINDLYSSALMSAMTSGDSVASRPIAPRRATQSTLWLVPMELLLDTFSYLDYRSMCFGGAVCVRWRVISENPSLWKAIAHRCGSQNVNLTPHCNPKEVVKRYIMTHRAAMDQELNVVEHQLQSTNRRLEERLQALPPFVAPLVEEHDAPETRRLPTVISNAEGKMTEMNDKIESFQQLQMTLTRTQRDNKDALVRTEGELRRAEMMLDRVRDLQQKEADLQGFEQMMVRALTDDLEDSELPLVLRRGLSTFFELELLVLQTSAAATTLGRRWSAFKRKLPLDDTWTSLRSKHQNNQKQHQLNYTTTEKQLLQSVRELKAMSRRDLALYVEKL